MPHPIVAEELLLLEEVSSRLAENPEPGRPSEEAIVRELERIRESLLSREDSKDRDALEDQWFHQRAVLSQLRRSRLAPVVDLASPYFGHLRLCEGGRERDLCLGKATRIVEGVRIVDWRHAPVSRVFYRYEQGEEYAEEMGGRVVEGRVVARRTVAIERGRLDRVEAPEGTFVRGDGTPGDWRAVEVSAPRLAGGERTALRVYDESAGLERRLGTDLVGDRRRVDKRLPDIAGLIDPEQFDLITRPDTGFVVVRGTAGSGKTTVALHRIAYLAYEDEAVDSAQTLFVAFSPALKSYVGHVLPALGVTRVRVCTFREWARQQRRRLFAKLPRATRFGTPGWIRRVKLHPAMAAALEERIARVPGPRTVEQVIDDWASTLVDRSLLAEVFEERGATALMGEALERVTEWCRQRNDELFAWLDGDTEDAELDEEDDALLLRAWQLRIGPLPRSGRRALRYRHIAIDEVQDLAPIEVRVMLDCVDRHRSVTLAGDTQQHVLEDTGFTSWDEFFHEIGLDGAEVQTLRVSYRSSQEITEFSRALLGDLVEDAEPPRSVRSGPPVELFRFTDHGACVAFLADALKELVVQEPLASVALLAGSAETSELYAEGLRNSDVGVHRVERYEFSFAPGIEVTEVEQAKGLEFDYVILLDASEATYADTPLGRRLLHVGATRAVHQLWVTSVGPPALAVRAAAPGV